MRNLCDVNAQVPRIGPSGKVKIGDKTPPQLAELGTTQKQQSVQEAAEASGSSRLEPRVTFDSVPDRSRHEFSTLMTRDGVGSSRGALRKAPDVQRASIPSNLKCRSPLHYILFPSRK